jgi:cell division protein FtsB
MPQARSAAAVPRRHAKNPPLASQRVVVRAPSLRVRWDRVGRVGLLVVLAIVIGLYVQHTLSYFSTRSQADRQLAIVQQLRRENANLVRRQRALSDPATIVRDARALGMVHQGELPYVVTGLGGH